MSIFLAVLIGYTVGCIFSLFFIRKDIKKEMEFKYKSDIEQYQQIVSELTAENLRFFVVYCL